MKKLFIFIVLITANLVFFGQLPKKWKEVAEEDFSYNRDGDTSIHAVILQEKGSYEFDVWREELRMFYSVTRRVLILDSAGLNYNSLEIPYIGYDFFEEFAQFQGFTYNLEKDKIKKTKLKPKDVKTIKETDYNYRKIVKFRDVKVGSIIEYRYTIASLEFIEPRKWDFQHNAPTLYSELIISLPEFIAYRLKIVSSRNFLKSSKEDGSMNLNYLFHYIDPIPGGRTYVNKSFNSNMSFNFRTWDYTFIDKDIPALHAESFVDCKCNYQESLILNLLRVDRKTGLVGNLEIMAWSSLTKRLYQTTNEDYKIMSKARSNFSQAPVGFVVFNIGEWENVDNQLNKHTNFGFQLIRALPYKPIFRDNISITSTNNLEKMIDLYDYVRQNYKWNGVYDVLCSQNLVELLNTKKGNSADINLLLVYLLRKAELDANPVVLRTVDKGHFDEELATLSQLNHVIAMVEIDGKKYFLDATKPENPWYALAKNDLNNTGRVIKIINSKFVAIRNNVETYSKSNVTVSVDNDIVTYKFASEDNGYWAADYRKDTTSSNSFLKINFENFSDRFSVLKYSFSLIENYSENKIYPIKNIDFETPFLNPYRTMAIYFGYSFLIEHEVKVLIPDGKKLVSMPRDKNIVINGADFIAKATENEGYITIYFKLNIKKDRFDLSEYTELRNLFFDVEEFINTPLVFE